MTSLVDLLILFGEATNTSKFGPDQFENSYFSSIAYTLVKKPNNRHVRRTLFLNIIIKKGSLSSL
jgi:hypothetical protein